MKNIIAYSIQFKMFVFVLLLHTMTNAALITTKYSEAGSKLSDDSAFSAPFANGDTIDLPYHYGFIIADVKDAVIGGLRVINNVSGCILSIQQPTRCGSITGAASGVVNRATIVYHNPSSLILTGTVGQDNDTPKNTYDFAKIDFNNTKSMLTISVPLILDVQIINAHNATLNINNDVTFKQKLDLGRDGNILFGTASKLNVNKGITGNVDFIGKEGVLKLADSQTITGNIDSTTDVAGTLEFLGTGIITGDIGQTNALNILKFSGAGDITLPSANTKTIEVANAGAKVTAHDALTGNVLFSNDGTLIASKGVNGTVSTITDNTGTITINSGDVGVIGTEDKHLKQINLNHSINANVDKLYASHINIGGTGTITANDVIKSAVSFRSNGTLVANKGITGNVDFIGKGGVLKLADSQTITGNIDSTTDVAGTLEFLGTGIITGDIGQTNALNILKFSGAGDITLPSANTKTIEVANAGAKVTAHDALTGNVLFSNDGTLIASKGVNGTVSTITDNTGTITINSGDVGVIGTEDKHLKQINLNHSINANVDKLYASHINIGGTGAITANDVIKSAVSFRSNGTLVANKGITGNVDFIGKGGVLKLADSQTITGNIDSTTDVAGTLEFLGTGIITGDIGQTNALNILKFSGAGDITLPSANTKTIEVANAGAKVTAHDALTGNVLFSNDGTLIASKGVNGTVSTITDNTGTITINSGDVGVIGTEDKHLKQINLNHSINANVDKLYASHINIGGTGAITANDVIKSAVSFRSNGTLVANKGITGNVDFIGKGGVLKLADSQTITGNIDSTTDVAGTLEFLGTGIITGDIGQTNALNILKFSGAGDITLPSANTKTIEVANAGAKVTAHDALTGNVLFSNDGTLIASKGVNGTVSTITDNTGTITINSGDVGVIGTEDKHLKQINLNHSINANVDKLYASHINIGGTGAITANDVIKSAVSFRSNGTLVANKGITGNVDFIGKGGVLKLADSQTITGNIDSTTDVAGTLEFLGTGIITGDIGQTNALNILKFSGAGDITLPSANTKTIEVANAGAKVTAHDALTGNVLFSNDGTLIASKGVNGTVSTITDNTGTITINSGDVGVIGTEDKHLKQINLNHSINANVDKLYASHINIGGTGTITANDVIKSALSFRSNGTLVANKGITGNVDFIGKGGVLKLADSQTITGNIDSTTDVAGTLEFLGTGIITGDIGQTNALNILKFSGAGDITLPSANTKTIEVANAGAKVTAHDALTGNVLFSNDGTLIASKGVNGTVSTITDNTGTITINSGDVGVIGTEDKHLKQINLNHSINANVDKLYASHINIGGTGTITANDVIKSAVSFRSNGTLVANKGITGNVDFIGKGGVLKLADSQTITGNIDSTTDVAGTLEFLGTGIITGDIGQTNALNILKFSGAGDITLPSANTKTIEVANAGAKVTAHDALTGNVLFSNDGTLIASKGVNGTVSTITDNTGTITINSGDVGVIGTEDKHLKQINLNHSINANVDKLYASHINIGGTGTITANDVIKSAVSFRSNGTLVANKGITGNVDFIGKGGVLKLADSQTITGNIDSTTDVAGTLEFLGTGIITGDIGQTNALNILKFSGAGDITLPSANTKTIEVANAGAKVTAHDALTGNVLFSNDGTLIASKGVNGTVSTITDNTGTITINSGDVGVIGTEDKHLKQINLNHSINANVDKLYASHINIGGTGAITANDVIKSAVSFRSNGTLVANKGITGNVDFIGKGGVLKLADSQTITGNIDSTTDVAGTLEFLGTGIITGDIGQTNALNILKFSGAGDITLPSANTKTIEVANAGAKVTAHDALTGNVLFSNDGTLIASKGVNGTVSTITDNTGTITINSGDVGVIGTEDKHLKQINLNHSINANVDKLYASHINIGGTGAITANDVIKSAVSFRSNGTLVANKGITGNVDFIGKGGVLKLADSQTITGNIDSTTDVAGTLEFLGTGIITGDIGQTNALNILKFSGAGDITLPSANTKTIEVANAGAKVTAHDALTGNVLFSNDGTLIASKGVNGTVSTITDNTGTITINSGDVGVIGTEDKHLKQINLNHSINANVDKLYASHINIGGTGTITANDVIKSAVSFRSNGTLVANKGITGNVDFIGKGGVLKLADSQTITGNIDSTTDVAGTLEFLGTGIITGDIGQTNALNILKFSGAGDITLPSANTKTIEVANAGAKVTAHDALTGNVLFSNDGTLIASKGVNGTVSTITDNTGTITINSGDVGVIGTEDKHLKQINLNHSINANVDKLYASHINIGGTGAITANDVIKSAVSFRSNGTLVANKGITGNVDFIGKGGVLKLADSQTITGNIDSTTDVAGTLEFLGTGIITGDIGQTNALNILKFSGAGDITLPSANTKTIEVANAGAKVTAHDALTGNVLFSNDGTLIASKGVNGTVSTITDNTGTITINSGDVGVIGTEDKHLKQINLNHSINANVDKLYASHINIGGTGTITANDVIKSAVSFRSNGTLVANKGITGNVDFIGKGGVLKLADSQTITGNIDSTTDVAGTLEFLGTGIITGDIGQTNALNILKFSGAGDITLPSANTKTIEVANAGAKVTAHDALTGNVLFSNDGTLIASKGVNGTVSTITDNTGTITINSGDVGVIGTEDKHLKQINLNHSINANVDKLYASHINIGGTGAITANDVIKSAVSFRSNGTLVANKGITGNVDFIGKGGVLKLADSQTITGNIDSTTDVAGTLEFLGTGIITGDIGQTNALNILKFSGAGDITLPSANTKTIEVANAGAKVTAHDALTGNVLFSNDGTLIASKGVNGTVSTITDNTGTITINSGDVGVIGTEDKHLKQINLNHSINANVDKLYASNIHVTGKGPILFNDSIHANNIYMDNANIRISDNIAISGNINASNTNLSLDNKTLTLYGTNTFDNHVTISSTYDESSLVGGNIILTSGSTLDLSNVSSLIIKLSCINSDISKINNDTKYNIIIAEAGSHIILLHDPEHQIILDSSGEQNKFVKWTIDSQSLTLYASDNSNNVIDRYVFDSQQNNTFIQQLKDSLLDSIAQQFKNNIGLLSKEQIEEMLSRILDNPKERSSDIVRVALHQILIDTNRTAVHAINDRLFGTNLAVVTAGDEDISRYGIWARSSLNQSKDKVNSKNSKSFSSYTTRGHSNTIGADGWLCNNLLIGAAYTNAYTSIRPKDQNIGNIDKVRTNMFSFYSAYNIPHYDWYLDSTISYAKSSIKGHKIRTIAVAKNILGGEVASSKYKSLLYTGSISLGYHHHINKNIYVTPSLGLIGSVIRDRDYTESGTSFQNLNVLRKKYNTISGIAGLRANQNIYLDNVIVTPEAYGFVNYNIKNKTPAIDVRLSGVDGRLPTIRHRCNRVNYSVGLGVTIKQNMMEYGIHYDANLAKKYHRHAGNLKVRLHL